MTIQEYIVYRSSLPANGHYTMLDHIQSMMLEIQGRLIGSVNQQLKVYRVSITSSKVNIKVQQSTIRIIVSTDELRAVVSGTKLDIKVT